MTRASAARKTTSKGLEEIEANHRTWILRDDKLLREGEKFAANNDMKLMKLHLGA